MKIIPLTLKQANDYIQKYHRHHKPTVGHRYSLGASQNGELIGVAVVGRPVARMCNAYTTAEVTRLCTNGGKNVCSFLYSACARVAKEMGFERIQTYILESEPGTSLIATGWNKEVESKGGQWKHTDGKTRRTDQPTEPKTRWGKDFVKQ